MAHIKNRQCRDAHTEKYLLSVLEGFLHIRQDANLGGKIFSGKTVHYIQVSVERGSAAIILLESEKTLSLALELQEDWKVKILNLYQKFSEKNV